MSVLASAAGTAGRGGESSADVASGDRPGKALGRRRGAEAGGAGAGGGGAGGSVPPAAPSPGGSWAAGGAKLAVTA